MDFTTSSLPLTKYDQQETNSTYDSDDNGSVSSGYESCDSSQTERETSPPPRHPTKEMMVFKSRESLCDNLDYILSMPELCDVVFLLGEEKTPVYGVKAILATRSRVLYQLILHNQRDVKVKKKKVKGERLEGKLMIEVKNYDEDVFRRFISFVHCGKVKVDMKTVIGLFCAGVEFGMKDLRNACWDYFQRIVKKEKERLIKETEGYINHKGIKYILNQLYDVTEVTV